MSNEQRQLPQKRIPLGEYLRKRRRAVAVAAICVVGFALLGSLRSVNAVKRTAEKLFDSSDPYCVEALLEETRTTAENYVTVSGRVLDGNAEEVLALSDACAALEDAKSIDDKYTAWRELLDCVDTVYYAMEGCEMSEKDSHYREGLREDIISYSKQIRHSDYNEAAEEANAKLEKSLLPGATLPIFE